MTRNILYLLHFRWLEGWYFKLQDEQPDLETAFCVEELKRYNFSFAWLFLEYKGCKNFVLGAVYLDTSDLNVQAAQALSDKTQNQSRALAEELAMSLFVHLFQVISILMHIF